MPLGKLFTGYNQKSEESATSMKIMHSVLYGNKVIFKSAQYSGENIETNIEYTYDLWLSYQTLDEEESPDPTNTQ